MRCVTYAGQTVVTTDDVAEALVALTAAIASFGEAEAVRIPIVREESGEVGEAELVIGVGNDVLSAPTDYVGDHDFSDAAEALRSHRHFPRDGGSEKAASSQPSQQPDWKPDLDGAIDYI